MRLPLFMARDSQRALDRLLADCARDAVCAAQFPHLGQTVQALWAHLASRPTVHFTHPRTGRPETLTVSHRLVASVVFQALYCPRSSALLLRPPDDAEAVRHQGRFALAFPWDTPGSGEQAPDVPPRLRRGHPARDAGRRRRESAAGSPARRCSIRVKPCASGCGTLMDTTTHRPPTRPVLIFWRRRSGHAAVGGLMSRDLSHAKHSLPFPEPAITPIPRLRARDGRGALDAAWVENHRWRVSLLPAGCRSHYRHGAGRP